MSDAKRVELERDEVDPFDNAGSELTWRAKDRHIALRGADGRLAASLGMVDAKLEFGDGRQLGALGIGGVIVAAPHRGQGLARRLISEALERGAETDAELALLFCLRDRAGLYVRTGFTEIAVPVLVQQAHADAVMTEVSMWRPLRDGVELGPAPLRLLSPPF